MQFQVAAVNKLKVELLFFAVPKVKSTYFADAVANNVNNKRRQLWLSRIGETSQKHPKICARHFVKGLTVIV